MCFRYFFAASPASKSWPKRSATTPRELTLGSVVLGTRRLTRGASRLREPSSQKARASRGRRRVSFDRGTLVLSLSKNATSISEALTSRRRNVRGKVKRLDFRAPWRRTHAHDARHRHHAYFTVYDDLGYFEAAPRYSHGYRRRARRLLEPSPRRDLRTFSDLLTFCERGPRSASRGESQDARSRGRDGA